MLLRKAVQQCAELRDLKLEIKDNAPLDRAMLDAADVSVVSGDYRRAALVLRTYLAFAYGSFGKNQSPQSDDLPGIPAALRADLQGLESFAVAVSFEAAGDWVPAVTRYREVLQLNGPRVPIQKATERLAAIGKSNPDLLKQPMASH